MKVVILAGGYGTRISEESLLKPKPMIEIGDRPILWHIMKAYSYYGFHDFIICAGYKQHVIKEWFADFYLHNTDVTFDLENNHMTVHNSHSEAWTVTVVDTGLNTMTGGRLKRIRSYIGDQTFLLTYGDGLCDVDIGCVARFHKEQGKLATITAIQPGGRFGALKIRDHLIEHFAEKKKEDGGWVNGGYMVLEPAVMDYIAGDDTTLEAEPLERLSLEGQLAAYKHSGFWQCMDTMKDKLYLEQLITEGNAPWMVWESGKGGGGISHAGGNMHKVIVSGAGGFIGSALVKELAANGITVAALGHSGQPDGIADHPLVTWHPFSMEHTLQLEERLGERDFDTFYHLAWAGSAGEGRADTALQMQNAAWAADCVRLAKRLGCSRFVMAGSIMELEAVRASFHPGNRPGPGYIYGAGKLAAHMVCKSVAAQAGMDFVCAMITNAYGAGEKSPRMVNTAIRKCIRGERPEFTAGTQNYDFVYIDDAARALRLIGERGQAFYDYRIGSSDAKPLREFLMEMQEAVAPDLEFLFGAAAYTGISLPLSDFDCSQTEADTGFCAEISFGEGCKKTRDWILAAAGEGKDEPDI